MSSATGQVKGYKTHKNAARALDKKRTPGPQRAPAQVVLLCTVLYCTVVYHSILCHIVVLYNRC